MSALALVRRRQLISAMAAAPMVLPRASRAQAYPTKPIRFIVPTPAGSGPDVDIRHIASRASPLLGQPIVIENRPGAGTRIAIEAAARSVPDGYTFLLGTPSLTTAPSLYSKLPFDAERDLIPVSLLSTTAYALTVNAAVPAPSLAAYIAAVKSDVAHGNIGTFGVGTIPHLSGAWFASLTGAQFKFVHYNTTPPVSRSAGRSGIGYVRGHVADDAACEVGAVANAGYLWKHATAPIARCADVCRSGSEHL